MLLIGTLTREVVAEASKQQITLLSAPHHASNCTLNPVAFVEIMAVFIRLWTVAQSIPRNPPACSLERKALLSTKARYAGQLNTYTSGKNHFHEMNGDVGMAGWK